jgi:hypothetical protein
MPQFSARHGQPVTPYPLPVLVIVASTNHAHIVLTPHLLSNFSFSESGFMYLNPKKERISQSQRGLGCAFDDYEVVGV